MKTSSAEFLKICSEELTDTRNQINEVTKKQRQVITDISKENSELRDKSYLVELNELLAVVRMYQHKVIMLKSEMIALQDRSTHLKERAIKLKQNKDQTVNKN